MRIPANLKQAPTVTTDPSTRISYEHHRGRVVLRIYDVVGRFVATLVDGRAVGGTATAEWNGTNSRGQRVASGLYFYELRAADIVRTRKMLLLE